MMMPEYQTSESAVEDPIARQVEAAEQVRVGSTHIAPGNIAPTAIAPKPPTAPRSRLWSAAALATFSAAVVTAALAAGSRSNGRSLWYLLLRKPKGQPPPQVFGPVWTVLYGLMVWSAYRVYLAPASPERTRALAAWFAQLGANGLWSYFFFVKHEPTQALIDNVVLLGGIGTYAALAGKVDKQAALLMIPYLGWSSYAAYLNEEIVRLNEW